MTCAFITQLNKVALVLMASVAFVLSGCSGGGSAGQQDAQLTCIFVDEYVVNLEYRTANHSGLTDSTGAYKYDVLGEDVAFSFSGSVIGYANAGAYITPHDIVDESGTPVDPVNLALLLQSLDNDGNPENGILLPTTTNITMPSSINFNDRTEVEQLIQNLGFTPKDINSVEAHLDTSMAILANRVLAPGRFNVTTYRAFRWVTRDYRDWTVGIGNGNESCNVAYTNIDVEITDIAIVGSMVSTTNGEVHSFNIPFDGGTLSGMTDAGEHVGFYFRSSEWGRLSIPYDDGVSGTPCIHTYRLDRDGGLNLPPVGKIEGSVVNGYNFSFAPNDFYACATHEGEDDYYFEFSDPDGWITNATVEWSSGTGGGGVIDLLTESEDVGHFVRWKGYVNNIVNAFTGEITLADRQKELWYGGYPPLIFVDDYGVPPLGYAYGEYVTHPFSHPNSFYSNPSDIYGSFVTRGRDPRCLPSSTDIASGFIEGPVSITLRLTDNDGYNFSINYVINDAGNTSPTGGTYFAVDEDWSNPADYLCIEYAGPDAATFAATANASSDPIALKGFVQGSCPSMYSGDACDVSAGGGNTATVYFTDLALPANTLGFCDLKGGTLR